ncbi:MAG TPA: hypothetical protein VN258_11795 [Mobilitalea sp.]|nr:hypothetical protein [Mobilitalea sp.]
MIKDAVKLYIEEGTKIADVTYGRGVFWRVVDKNKYQIIGSDIKTGIDFRKLPYENSSFDHSVIDPLYARIEDDADDNISSNFSYACIWNVYHCPYHLDYCNNQIDKQKIAILTACQVVG